MPAIAPGLSIAVPPPVTIAAALSFWIAGWIAGWIACGLQIRDGERFLEGAFGTAHLACKERVRRWI